MGGERLLTEVAALRGLLALALGLAGFLAVAFGVVVFFVAATFLVPAGFYVAMLECIILDGMFQPYLCSASSFCGFRSAFRRC